MEPGIHLRQETLQSQMANHAEPMAAVNDAHWIEAISFLAHELRSPLASIVGYADLLADPELRPPEAALDNCYGAIARNGRQAIQLVEDLLLTSRLEADPMAIQPAPLALNEFLMEIVREAREKYPREIVFQNYPEEAVVDGDALRLRDVLINLIDNANKYSKFPQPILIGLAAKGNHEIEIRVQDYGIGLESGEISQLFQRFSRIKNERTRGITGTGLGLHIVKTIVERHHGKIRVDSQVGEGTIFTITLLRSKQGYAKSNRAL